MGKLLMMKSRKLLKNILITLGLTALATSIAFWFFHHVPENPANIALVYITALVLIARFTDGYLYGVLASLAGVIFVNYLFTYPYFELNFTLTGYPVTFLFMLIISITISAMTVPDQRSEPDSCGTRKAAYGCRKGKNAGQSAAQRIP